ncbi:MAG: hypothetical protein R3C39_09135 [Dehalococcoidia bacterium]
MHVALMGVLVLGMLGVQFWIRTYHYSRAFRPAPRVDASGFWSPVNGTVVYVREVIGDDVYCDKGDRQVKTPLNLEAPYAQLGVFVGPYDNHHVLAPTAIEASTLHRVDVMDAVNVAMVTLSDRLLGFAGWWERHLEGFLSHNQRIILSWTPEGWPSPCYLVIIMDRFLNRFFEASDREGRHASGEVLGFIGRGSQVDVFVPCAVIEGDPPRDLVGHRVTPDTALLRLAVRQEAAHA